MRRLDGPVPDCEVEAIAKSGAYRFVEDFFTDPGHNSVLIHVRFMPLAADRGPFHLYLWFDPTINGNGGGGVENDGADTLPTATFDRRLAAVSYDRDTISEAANRTYAQPVYAALTTSHAPWRSPGTACVGTAGDGLSQLDRSHRLTQIYMSATDGNVAQTVAVAARSRQLHRCPGIWGRHGSRGKSRHGLPGKWVQPRSSRVRERLGRL